MRGLRRRLGQDDDGDDSGLFYTPGGPGVIQAGGPTYEPGTGPSTPPDILPTGIPGGAGATSLPSSILQNIATGGLNLNPATSAATLLAAAQLPGAPATVIQAAQQYRAANPITAAASSPLGGFPAYYWVIGGLALLALVGLAAHKRR